MSLLLRRKRIIGANDRWQNFNESGPFWKIHPKLRKRSSGVMDGLIRLFFFKLRKFVKIHYYASTFSLLTWMQDQAISATLSDPSSPILYPSESSLTQIEHMSWILNLSGLIDPSVTPKTHSLTPTSLFLWLKVCKNEFIWLHSTF